MIASPGNRTRIREHATELELQAFQKHLLLERYENPSCFNYAASEVLRLRIPLVSGWNSSTAQKEQSMMSGDADISASLGGCATPRTDPLGRQMRHRDEYIVGPDKSSKIVATRMMIVCIATTSTVQKPYRTAMSEERNSMRRFRKTSRA